MASPPATAAWDKLHSKLATISTAVDIDKTSPCMLLNAHPIISEFAQSTESFLKSMISVSLRKRGLLCLISWMWTIRLELGDSLD